MTEFKGTYKRNLPVIWNDEYKKLDYTRESFNDPESIQLWKKHGYVASNFVGKMADFRKRQPEWTKEIKRYFEDKYHWKDVGASFYLMETCNILPVHKDLYARYKQAYELWHGEDIWRAVVFLEDRKNGHIFEINGDILDWKAGDYVIWKNDLEHSAANIGIELRYTLQITGWKNAVSGEPTK